MQAAFATTAGKERSAGKWLGIFRSPLALTMMGVFLLIALVEASFLGLLCLDVINADKNAARQFDMLHGSQQISHVIRTAQKCFDAADIARKDKSNTAAMAVYNGRLHETVEEMNAAIQSFEHVGLDTSGAVKLRDSFSVLNKVLQGILAERGDEAKEEFRRVLELTGGMYQDFGTEIKAIHAALNSGAQNTEVLGIKPEYLIYLSAAVNLALVLLLLLAVDKWIVRPLASLSSNCDRILLGELMPKPSSKQNEVGALQQSFYEMSLVVSENEKRRHSFLEFFQSVQSASLENVRDCFDALLAEELAERAKRSIQKAKTNLGTLMQLLQSMTDALSFKTNSAVRPQKQATSTGLLISAAALAVEALLQKRQIQLEIVDGDYACELDPNLIGRVLVNFLSNAIKYSPDKGQVQLLVEKQDGLLKFSVKDQGPGISEEGISKLFKEFSQLDSADGVKRSGTGLGLVICKQIVEAHAGKVGVTSELGKGSCFWFQLPEIAQELDSDSMKTAPQAKRQTKLKSLNRQFMVMLLFLLVPQSIIVWRLHGMFSELSARAHSFYIEKEIMMLSEEMLSDFLVWKLTVAKAIDGMQVAEIGKTQPLITALLNNDDWMIAHISKKSQSYHELKRIHNGFLKLRKFGDYLTKNQDNLNLAVLPKLVAQARKLARDVEASMFEILKIEDSNIQSTYEGSAEMRSELLGALAFAALVNFLTLAGLSFLGLKITERIAALKHKAEDFAGGKRLEPSLSGSDELHYLDLRLCEVSQAIKDADSQRQKLIAVINHDLRTPLSSIINGLQMILSSGYGEIGQKEKALTQAAERELNRLLQQINDLLLIEKIDAGLYKLSPEKFEVLPLLAATARSFDLSASERGVRVLPEFAPDCEELCINGDKALLEREFAIIMANALEAAPEGSVIDVSVERAGDKLCVSFKDHGAGINEELLPQIFERFRFIGGKPVTGLGLPLAQRLSTINGGSLQINSTPLGTVTRVSLPIAV